MSEQLDTVRMSEACQVQAALHTAWELAAGAGKKKLAKHKYSEEELVAIGAWEAVDGLSRENAQLRDALLAAQQENEQLCQRVSELACGEQAIQQYACEYCREESPQVAVEAQQEVDRLSMLRWWEWCGTPVAAQAAALGMTWGSGEFVEWRVRVRERGRALVEKAMKEETGMSERFVPEGSQQTHVEYLQAQIGELRQQLATAERERGQLHADLMTLQSEALAHESGMAVTRHQKEEAEAGAGAMRKALEAAQHELVTLDGLTASDGLGEYGKALDDGCDASGAWDCYVEETWEIDMTKVLVQIDAALAADAGRVTAERTAEAEAACEAMRTALVYYSRAEQSTAYDSDGAEMVVYNAAPNVAVAALATDVGRKAAERQQKLERVAEAAWGHLDGCDSPQGLRQALAALNEARMARLGKAEGEVQP